MPAAERATLLGARFPVFEGEAAWRVRLGERYSAWNQVRGLPSDWPIPAEERSRIRTDTAREMFAEQHGREPGTRQELDGFLRQVSRPQSTAVAGYDLTFSPVKSVSALWAVAPPDIAHAIEEAHLAAVATTLEWLGGRVAYTRVGAGGAAQVDSDGLTCAVFTHRDSRAGDPDLHTHVAVSNKVRVAGSQDRWLALDGRMVHRYTVAGSELYNTILEAEVTARIGGRFAERPGVPGKRPVRELVGVNPELNARWSARREAITAHRQTLVAAFQAAHGRTPTPVEMVALSQQATLATRHAKHEPRSLSEQRATWHHQAVHVLGGQPGLDRMLADVSAGRDPGSPTRSSGPPRPGPRGPVTPGEVARMAGATVAVMADSRALWSVHNLAAEAARQVRAADLNLDPQHTLDVIERVTHIAADSEHSVPVGAEIDVAGAGHGARCRCCGRTGPRCIGSPADSATPRSRILDAEARIVTAAGARRCTDGQPSRGGTRRAGMVGQQPGGHPEHLPGRPRGTGRHHGSAGHARTRPRRYREDHRHGCPHPRMASQWRHRRRARPAGIRRANPRGRDRRRRGHPGQTRLRPHRRTAGGPGRVGSPDRPRHPGHHRRSRDRVHPEARRGDPLHQRPRRPGPARRGRPATRRRRRRRGPARHRSRPRRLSLTEVLRFTDPVEAQVSLALRAGDPAAAAFYTDRGRLHPVALDEAADTVYAAWAADIQPAPIRS